MQVDKVLEETLLDLPKLLRKRKEALDAKEEELKILRKQLEEKHPCVGTPSDVLRLNVGGKRIEVLRRTLTSLEGSMLAVRFSGRWDEGLEKDAEGNFFIDQDYDLFVCLINYMRARQNMTPLGPPLRSPLELDASNKEKGSITRRFDFIRMVEYYHATLGVYPVDFKLLRGDPQRVKMIGYPEFSVNAEEWMTVSLLPSDGHTREIIAFEVTLGTFSAAHIGWMDKAHELSFLESGGNKGVGESNKSIGFDCSRPGIIVGSNFHQIPDISIEEGTVLRCEKDQLQRWFVNGRLVATSDNPNSESEIVVGNFSMQLPVPCVSMKGSFRVSAIELSF